jgi:aryl-alcohol dehydrogenase-like predicted oxidoreductase
VFEAHRVDDLTPRDEVLEAFDQLVRHGKVRYVGFANWPAWMAGKAIGLQQGLGLARFRVAEMFYSLIGRDIEHSLAPLLEDAGIGLFVWSPLAGGLLSGKYTRENRDGDGGRLSRAYRLPLDWDRAFAVIEATLEIAKVHDATPAQVALA